MLLHQWGMLSDFPLLQTFYHVDYFCFYFFQVSLRIRNVDWLTYDYQAFNLIIAIALWDQLIFLKVSFQCAEAFLGKSYSLHLHKNLLTRDQQSFRNVFSNGNVTNQQWDIFSYNYPRILSTLRDVDAVKSKMQLFYLSLHRKND